MGRIKNYSDAEIRMPPHFVENQPQRSSIVEDDTVEQIVYIVVATRSDLLFSRTGGSGATARCSLK
jgi:hypothetical protein